MSSRHPNPVFVVGVFRSGTSLLYSVLNQHSRMALMYECDLWHFPSGLLPLRFAGNWLERQEFCNEALSRHRLIFGGGLRGLEAVKTPDDLYRIFAENKGAALWGEKSPLYGARLEQLARLYPGGSFILLWRDPVEVYRSVLQAGRQAPYFRRRGMLSRLIFYHEQMLRQSVQLRRAGVRVHHVTYTDLIDKTEQVCRGLCEFLQIEFDPKMLDLSQADFSAVFYAPHHEFLRRGRIQRRQTGGSAMDPHVTAKLERFRARWRRLQQQWLGMNVGAAAGAEPTLVERAFHGLSGRLCYALDHGKRAVLEFAPLPWLRTYRQLKRWFKTPDPEREPGELSFWKQCLVHRSTILASLAFLGAVATLDFLSGPRITFAPFYLIACAIPTLVIGARWGSLIASLSAVSWTVLQNLEIPGTTRYSVLLWNCAMRFVLLYVVVRLLDRVRREINAGSSKNVSTAE